MADWYFYRLLCKSDCSLSSAWVSHWSYTAVVLGCTSDAVEKLQVLQPAMVAAAAFPYPSDLYLPQHCVCSLS
ncbi:hypothetical protein ONE63_010200 [Megalurothrips usitatus]|uniref:Uncharacterized protein n=1 Tax=Megalurothrips usitatus TaxID=439358 RepID=A0AAV7XLB7_9NEOP|nr:hypothetical protein ONE63_010200 [Megalurothrips usitatus]